MFGKLYYQKLKQIYQTSDSLFKMLKAPDSDTSEVNGKLIKAAGWPNTHTHTIFKYFYIKVLA